MQHPLIRHSSLGIISLFTMLAVACSSIDGDERLDYVPPANVSRAVLIEDFTGQMCINCPVAHETIERIQKQYGTDNVIAVSIHGGELALYSRGNVTGLRTPLGDDYTAHWHVDSWPVALINRRGGLLNEDKWAGTIHDELERASSLLLTGEATLSPDASQTNIDITVTALDDIDAHLQLWLVEDSIRTLQRLPDNSSDQSYLHNNVLRSAVNGTWGTPLSLTKGQTFRQTFTASFDPAWVVSHIAVVAFVYIADGVEQVIKVPINNQ